MNNILITGAVVVAATAATVFWWARRPQAGPSPEPEAYASTERPPLPAPTTLEEKLAVLASCGITLRPEFSIDDLLTSWPRDDYEEPGFNTVLVGLGMTEEQPPWRHRSDNLWHFDTECIEDHGSYVAIAQRMMDMAGGSLPLADLEDRVDIDAGQAWLSFTLDGKPTRITCKVDNDWVDPNVFGHFVKLLAKTDPAKLFVYYDLGGQDCIIGCMTRRDFQKLRAHIPKLKPLD